MKWMVLWWEAWRKEEDLYRKLQQKIDQRTNQISLRKCRQGRENYHSLCKTTQGSLKRKKLSWNLQLKILSKWRDSFNQWLKTSKNTMSRPKISEICSVKLIQGTTCHRIGRDKLTILPQKSQNSKRRKQSCKKRSRGLKMSKRRDKLRQSSS